MEVVYPKKYKQNNTFPFRNKENKKPSKDPYNMYQQKYFHRGVMNFQINKVSQNVFS